MKKIKIEFTNERIIPASGLAVVGAILGKCDFVKRCNRMDVTPNRSQHQIKVEAGCHFIIKRNLRKESKEDWLKMAQEYSKDVETPRDGKTVYIGSDWKPVSY